jgi:hypothetical protein
MTINAQQAHQRAKPGDTVIGWRLDRDQRRELLLQFPPVYAEVVADHVTFPRGCAHVRLPSETMGEIVGRADDGNGVEAMVVSIGGTTTVPTEAPTISPGRSPKAGARKEEQRRASVTAAGTPIELPVPVMLAPAAFR